MSSIVETLEEWGVFGRAAGHSPQTIAERRWTIERLGAAGLDPLTAGREELTRWLADLSVSRSSRATYRSQLRAFYAWLADTGRREDDPALKLPTPRAPRGIPHPLTPPEVAAVLASCEDGRSWQTRAYVLLAAYAGLRAHEIAKIRGEDFQGDLIYVTGKGGVSSTVPIHPMIDHLRGSMPTSGFWFPTNSASGHVHRCSVSTAIQRAFHRAGVRAVPHALRHHYCTQVLRASGGDLRTTQRAARHASPATTAIYTQIADETLARAVCGIPGQVAQAPAETPAEDPIDALDWQPAPPCESTRPENVLAHGHVTPPATHVVRRLGTRKCCGRPYPDAGRVCLTCKECVDRLLGERWSCDACGQDDLPYTTWYEISPL